MKLGLQVATICFAITLAVVRPSAGAEIWLDADGDSLADSDTLAVAVDQPETIGVWIDSESYTWTYFDAYIEYGTGLTVDSAAYIVSGGLAFPIDNFTRPRTIGLAGSGYSRSGVTKIGELYAHATNSGLVCLTPLIDIEAEPASYVGTDTSYAAFTEAHGACLEASGGDHPDDSGEPPGGPDTPQGSNPPPLPSGVSSIIENDGQLPSAVKFYARGAGGTVFFMENGLTVDRFTDSVSVDPEQKRFRTEPDTIYRQGVVFRTEFLDASTEVSPYGAELAQGESNFFLGDDPDAWQTSVPSYGEVHYDAIYPQIDLVYRANSGELKYDLIVRPGGNPGDIRLRYSGVDSLFVTEEGSLAIEMGDGLDYEAPPLAYQGTDSVPARYVVVSDSVIRYEVDAFDSTSTLVIDPRLLWSAFLGGSGTDDLRSGNGIARDSLGNIYIAGETSSINFPTIGEQGVYKDTLSGPLDAFVTKFDPDGTVVYSTYLGGNSYDYLFAVAVEPSGIAAVTGWTGSNNFPTTPGVLDRSFTGTSEAFVTRINAAGSGLLYSTYLGGAGRESGNAIAVASNSEVIVGGWTSSSDFPHTYGVYDSTQAGNSTEDCFVTRLNSGGSAPVFSGFLGSPGNGSTSLNDEVLALVLDPGGNIYVTGWTSSDSSGFPTTAGAWDRTYNGAPSDAFIAKFNPTESTLLFSTYVGGNGADQGWSIDVNSSGEPVVCGFTASSNFPATTGAFDGTHDTGGSPPYDAFIARMSSNASSRIFATYLGSNGADYGEGVRYLSDGSVGCVLTTWSTSGMPVTGDADDGSQNGQDDLFLARIASNGTAVLHGSYVGGNSYDGGSGLVIGPYDFAYVASATQSLDFPGRTGGSQGVPDVALFKYYLGAAVGVPNGGATEPSHLMPTLTVGPNPWKAGTLLNIRIESSTDQIVSLSVFDISGRLVEQLLNSRAITGNQALTWDGRLPGRRSLDRGFYFFRLETPSGVATRKVAFVK